MYAIVKTGGKQYRVEQGESLVVERLRGCTEGDTVALSPLLYVDGDSVLDGDELGSVSVSARVVGHERGPKLRIVKFKPKRGYKRRTGHRQELTRLEVTEIKLATRRARGGATEKAAGEMAAEKAAAEKGAAKPAAGVGEAAAPKPVRASRPATGKAPAARKPRDAGAATESKPRAPGAATEGKPRAPGAATEGKPRDAGAPAARKPRAPKPKPTPKEETDGT